MLLKNRTILIMGIRNKWSIAYGIAKSAYENGAKLLFTYMGEENKNKIEELISEFSGSKAYVLNGASEDEKVILSFLHKDYENKELEIIKNKEECLSVISVYSYDYLEEYLWKNKETDIYDYLKARYIDRRLDFSKFEKEYGFLDFSQSEIEDCIEAFDRFEEAEGWDEIVRDRTLNFKRYSPASNKDDWFRKSEFKDKKIYKFRCKNTKRCFGYREGEKFYVLRMERDHKISDNG